MRTLQKKYSLSGTFILLTLLVSLMPSYARCEEAPADQTKEVAEGKCFDLSSLISKDVLDDASRLATALKKAFGAVALKNANENNQGTVPAGQGEKIAYELAYKEAVTFLNLTHNEKFLPNYQEEIKKSAKKVADAAQEAYKKSGIAGARSATTELLLPQIQAHIQSEIEDQFYDQLDAKMWHPRVAVPRDAFERAIKKLSSAPNDRDIYASNADIESIRAFADSAYDKCYDHGGADKTPYSSKSTNPFHIELTKKVQASLHSSEKRAQIEKYEEAIAVQIRDRYTRVNYCAGSSGDDDSSHESDCNKHKLEVTRLAWNISKYQELVMEVSLSHAREQVQTEAGVQLHMPKEDLNEVFAKSWPPGSLQEKAPRDSRNIASTPAGHQ